MAGAAVESPAYPWDVLQADACLQFYPWRDLVFTSWQGGNPPYYNPYQLAGVPLLANSQSAGFYPLHMLVGFLHIPTSLGLTLLALFHLAWAGLGVERLARRFGAHPMGAMMGGLSFTLSPFMLGWTGLASVITTVSWIPWVLALIFDSLSPDSETGRPRVPSWIWLALSTGMMILGGHLQFVAFGGLAAVLLAICLMFAHRSGAKKAGLTLAGLVLGVLLAGPQLMPALEYSKSSHRRNVPTADGFAAYQSSAIKPWELGNIVNPMQLGNPREFAVEGGPSTYWPALAKRGANWTESAVGPGAMIVACLCVLPLVRRRVSKTWPIAVVGLFGLLVAFGSPINAALYFGVPGWSSTGSPGRAIVLFVLAACVLAGVVIGNLIHREEVDGTHEPFSMRGLQLSVLAFGAIAFASFAIGQQGAVPPEGMNPEGFRAVVGAASSGGLMVTLLLAFFCAQPILISFFSSRMKIRKDISWSFPLMAVVAALLSGATSIIPTGTPIEGPKELKAQSERVAYVNENWELVAAAPATMPPNLSTIRRELDVSGYDSLLHKDVQMWISAIDNDKDPAPPANGNIMFVKSSPNLERLAEAGVGSFDGQAFDSLGRASLLSNGLEVPVKVTEQTLKSVTVAVDQPGQLTLRDHNLGGWAAFAGDRELPLKPGRWLVVDVPEGTQTVIFVYAPPGLKTGLACLAVSLVVLIIGFLLSRRLTKNQNIV